MSRHRWVAVGIGTVTWGFAFFNQAAFGTQATEAPLPPPVCSRVISIHFSKALKLQRAAASAIEAPPTFWGERRIVVEDHADASPEAIRTKLGKGARILAMPDDQTQVVVKGDRRVDGLTLEALRLQIAEGRDLSLAGIARARNLSEPVTFDAVAGTGMHREITAPLRTIGRPYQKISFTTGNLLTRGLKELVLHVTDVVSARLVASFFPHGAEIKPSQSGTAYDVFVAGPPDSLALLHRLVVANGNFISPHLISLAIHPKIACTHSAIRTFLAGDPQVRDFTTSDEYVVNALGSFTWLETDSRPHAELIRWIFSDRAVIHEEDLGDKARFRVFVGASAETSAHIYTLQAFLHNAKGVLDQKLVERAARTVVTIVSPIQESSDWKSFLRDFVTGERGSATHYVRIDTASDRIAKRVVALLGENGYSEIGSPFVIVGVSNSHLRHLEALVDGILGNANVISSKIVFDAKQFVPLPSTSIVRAPHGVEGFVDTFGVKSSETDRRYELTLKFATAQQAATAVYLLDGRVYQSPDRLEVRLGATESSLAHLQALVRWVQSETPALLSAEMVRRARTSVAFNSEPMTVLSQRDGTSALDFPQDFATGEKLTAHVDLSLRCPVVNEFHAQELIAIFKGRAVLETHGAEKPAVLVGVKGDRAAHLRRLVTQTQEAGGVISTAMLDRFLRSRGE